MDTDYDKNSGPTVPVPRFVSRVYAYPIVQDACGQVVNAYSKVKDYNRMIHAGFELAESGLKLVTSSATPIITKFDNQITYIDNMTCKQLDKLEEKLPVVTKQTNELSKEAKVYLNDALTPKVEALENIYSNMKKKVVSVQEFGKNQLHKAADTSYGKLALNKVDHALNVTNDYIDYYLPENEKDKSEVDQPDYQRRNSNKESKPDDPLAKAGYLTSKMRKRMFAKAMSQLQQVKVRSFEAVEKMSFTVDLISYAKTQLQTVADKATHLENDFKYKLWELETSEENKAQQKEMNNEYDTNSSEQSATFNKTKERQLLNSLFYWSHKLNLSLQAGKAVLISNVPIPDRVKESYLMATETAQTLYNNVLNLKTSNYMESLPVVKKSFTTIDHYLKSFFDYLDETYKRLVSHKSHNQNCKNKSKTERKLNQHETTDDNSGDKTRDDNGKGESLQNSTPNENDENLSDNDNA